MKVGDTVRLTVRERRRLCREKLAGNRYVKIEMLGPTNTGVVICQTDISSVIRWIDGEEMVAYHPITDWLTVVS